VSSALLPGDARWIGCWWLGYLLVAMAILMTSLPLWFFPASMTTTSARQPHSSGGEEHTDTSRQLSNVTSTWTQLTGMCITPS